MAKVSVEGLENIEKYVNSKMKEYTKWYDDAASDDLYNAYISLADSIKLSEVGIHTAASKIPGGILVSGKNSKKPLYMNRWDPSRPALSYTSKNKYGKRVRVSGRGRNKTAMQITISNVLDLVWDQGYVALPEASENGIWTNPMGKWMRDIAINLGNQSYSGSSAKEILINYADDMSKDINEGAKIKSAKTRITEDIAKHFS